MLELLSSWLVSTLVTMGLVRLFKLRGSRFIDRDFAKPQGVHVVPVPRAGGVAILLGLLAGSLLLSWRQPGTSGPLALILLACAAPAFLAGLLHDLTDSWTPRGRLLATALSAALAYYALDAAILQTAIPGLDWVVQFAAGSLILTILAVAGIANSINIIDGMNGLASMCVALMLGAISYVAFQVDDPFMGALALCGLGAVLGFFIWNFPAGLIFLGDGGAYLLGFFVAEVSILLLVRNPGEVSPIFPLLVCVYPAFETLFSIYRRSFLRATAPSLPDGIHLHSLIYRRVMRWTVGAKGAKALTRRNSMTSPYLWLLCMMSLVPATLFWNNTAVLTIALLLFVVSYSFLYWRIVRFRSPRWMVLPLIQGRSRAARNRADKSH